MIKFRVTGQDELKKLSNDIRNMIKQIKDKAEDSVIVLHKNVTFTYEKHIYDLVYDLYEPHDYSRTYHLLGGHGATDEDIIVKGHSIGYEFSIDENSRDPEDGTTWGDKADNIEQGSSKMKFYKTVPFDRPFIAKTQEAIENENIKVADTYEKYVLDLIEKVARG